MKGEMQIRFIQRPWRFVEILCNAIIPAFVRSMYYDFFFRDIIVMGAFSHSSRSRMLIGPAVDEAALLYEAAEWVGLSTRIILRFSIVNNTSNLIVEYSIPQKPVSIMTWAGNWIQRDSSFAYWNIVNNKASYYVKIDNRKYMSIKIHLISTRVVTSCSETLSLTLYTALCI